MRNPSRRTSAPSATFSVRPAYSNSREASKFNAVWTKCRAPEWAWVGLRTPYDALFEFEMTKSKVLRPWLPLRSKRQPPSPVHSIPPTAEMSSTSVLISGRKPSG